MKLEGTINEFGYPVFKDVLIYNSNTLEGIKLDITIDTGAYGNYIKKKAANQLKLNSIGNSVYYNPLAGKVETDIYKVNIRFPQAEFIDIEAQNLIQDTYPTDFILGVTFFRFSKLVYDGINRLFIIEFP